MNKPSNAKCHKNPQKSFAKGREINSEILIKNFNWIDVTVWIFERSKKHSHKTKKGITHKLFASTR